MKQISRLAAMTLLGVSAAVFAEEQVQLAEPPAENVEPATAAAGEVVTDKVGRQQDRVVQRADSELDQASDRAVDKVLDKVFGKIFGD
jgi:hypothetical protein